MNSRHSPTELAPVIELATHQEPGRFSAANKLADWCSGGDTVENHLTTAGRQDLKSAADPYNRQFTPNVSVCYSIHLKTSTTDLEHRLLETSLGIYKLKCVNVMVVSAVGCASCLYILGKSNITNNLTPTCILCPKWDFYMFGNRGIYSANCNVDIITELHTFWKSSQSLHHEMQSKQTTI